VHAEIGFTIITLRESDVPTYHGAVSERRTSPVAHPHISFDACTPGFRKKLLGEAPLFEGLPTEAVDRVNTRFIDTGFTTGETILHEGDPSDRFYIIALGVVTLLRTTDEGESVVLDVLTTGDYFGSVAGYGPQRHTESAVARTTVCALSIDAEGFRSIISDHPSVALRTIETLSNRLHLAHELVTQLGGYPADVRIAYVLLRLAAKLGRPWEGTTLINAPMQREEIASMAGTTTETCSRTISAFRREGYLKTGRGWIALSDKTGLERLVATTER